VFGVVLEEVGLCGLANFCTPADYEGAAGVGCALSGSDGGSGGVAAGS